MNRREREARGKGGREESVAATADSKLEDGEEQNHGGSNCVEIIGRWACQQIGITELYTLQLDITFI